MNIGISKIKLTMKLTTITSRTSTKLDFIFFWCISELPLCYTVIFRLVLTKIGPILDGKKTCLLITSLFRHAKNDTSLFRHVCLEILQCQLATIGNFWGYDAAPLSKVLQGMKGQGVHPPPFPIFLESNFLLIFGSAKFQ